MPVTNDRDPRHWSLDRLLNDAMHEAYAWEASERTAPDSVIADGCYSAAQVVREMVRRLREQAAKLAAVEQLCRERLSPGCGCEGCKALIRETEAAGE